MHLTKDKQRSAQIFVKHIPSQTFCACFQNDGELGDFMRSLTAEQRRELWQFRRQDVKKYHGLDPDHLIIKPLTTNNQSNGNQTLHS